MPDLTLGREAHNGAGTPLPVSWAGNPWSLAGLCLLNIVLIVLTAGIYWFWSRTEFRRYMWQMVRVSGEPLEYTGTGKELLIGYLKLFLFVILPAIALLTFAQTALGPKNPLFAVILLVVYVGIFVLYFAGVFRANRYILSRTRWRGIAFGLHQGAAGYAWTSFWTALLTGLTLGWLWPWRATALRRRLTGAMHFGSGRLRFEGGSGPLYLPFAFSWLAMVLAYGGLVRIQMAVHPALIKAKAEHPGEAVRVAVPWHDLPHPAVWVMLAGIALFFIGFAWFEARKLNVFASATKFGGLVAHLEATPGSYLSLALSNSFILLFSAGILRPVTQARRLKYIVTRLAFLGSVDLDDILQGPDQPGSQGAGLEAAFSIEIF